MATPRPIRSTDLKLTDAVCVKSHSQNLQGIVAFLGTVSFTDGDEWVGVRLTGDSVGLGRNDGSVKEQRYFECPANCGLFVQRSHVTKRVLTKLEQLRLRRELAQTKRSPSGSPAKKNFSSSPLKTNKSHVQNSPIGREREILLSETAGDSLLESLLSDDLGSVGNSQEESIENGMDFGDNSLVVPLLSPGNAEDMYQPPPNLRRRTMRVPLETKPTRRLLDRDAAFHQSRGRWSIQRLSHLEVLNRTATARQKFCRLWNDWFHNLAYRPTVLLMIILFLCYTAAVFFFAFAYWLVSWLGEKYTPKSENGSSTPFCGMDITNHMEALYFSLSTMTTIGYGVSDYYFGDCWTPLLLVLWQVSTAITFDAVAIGLIFQRISRGQKRSKTIIFSDKAIIRRVRGEAYLMFRIGELRRHQVIEATIRAYCMRHERHPKIGENEHRIETTHFITRHLNLRHPDESTASHILMSLPQVIVHKLDVGSP